MREIVVHDRAEAYNKQKSLSEQQHCIDMEHLLACGQAFVEYGMHKDFGVSLLHRHTTIRTGDVMVHFMQRDSGLQMDICRPVPLERQDFSPYQYYLDDDDKLVPYEFAAEVETTSDPLPDFTKVFAGLLDNLDLRGTLGISKRRLDGPWYEYEAQQSSYTIATQQVPPMHTGSTITLWGFDITESGIKVVPEVICVTGQGKTHLIVPKPEEIEGANDNVLTPDERFQVDAT